VSGNKNRALKYLFNKGCEYVFLIEDDCKPVHWGWPYFYVAAMQYTGIEHFNFMPGCIKQVESASEKTWPGGVVIFKKECFGLLMAMSRKCIEAVGAFDPRFEGYGYGHCDWTERAMRAGFGGDGWYAHLPMDWYFSLLESSCITSPKKRKKDIAHNETIFNENKTNQVVYIPFEEVSR
jgi:GT2 family glycosyltransferase